MIDDTENDNNQDFEEIEDFDLEGDSFDDFENKGKAAQSLREKPLAKAVIVVVILLAIVGVFMFFQKDPLPSASSLPGASEMTAAPGQTEVSQSIREATEEVDRQRREEAEMTGTSALPTPLEPPVGVIPLPEDTEEEEDPLQRWRRLQQERIDREAERARLLQPETLQDQTVSPEALQAMADAMAAQMQIILEGRDDAIIQSVSLTNPDFLKNLVDEETGGVGTGEADISEILVPAGEILYAQLLIEANTDVPGPVLARIAGGPLNGSRILGTFQEENELLVLRFNTVVIDGVSQSMDGIALDPATTLPGLVSEVDHRYFTRIVLPAAAAFIEGTADAIAQSGQTTITITGANTTSTTDTDTDTDQEVSAGISDAANEVGAILDEIADDTPVMVRLKAGTPIGLLLLQPVLKEQ